MLCKGTYAEIAEIVHIFLIKKGCEVDLDSVKEDIRESYNRNMDKGEVKPRCADIRKVLGELRSKGINLCVVTTDNPEITHKCLKKLNIADMFEYVFTDDGITPPKPDSA